MRRAIYLILLLAHLVSAGVRSVTVCTSTRVQGPTLSQAQNDTTALFAGIGVQLNWPPVNAPCPQGSLQVAITENTPRTLRPGALAYSLPVEGIHIEVFYDRIFNGHRSTRRQVLAYVLAHEIGHVLQGLPRHSEMGIMKPFWSSEDYRMMLGARLKFAPADVALIYEGLAGSPRETTPSPQISEVRRTIPQFGPFCSVERSKPCEEEIILER